MITLFKGKDSEEKVTDISGTTYNLVEGKIVKTELNKSAIFHENVSSNRDGVKFTMPAAGAGSIIDFYYKIVSPFINIRDIPIQYDIPIDHLALDVRLSRSIVYNVAFNPEASYELSFSKEIKDEFLKNLQDFDPPKTAQNELIDKNYILTAKNKTVSLRTGSIPSYNSEKDSGGRNRYRSRLIFEIAATPDGFGRYKYYASDWNSVSKSIMKSQYFGGQLRSSNFYKKDLLQSIDLKSDDRNRALNVFDFLQDRVKWNGRIGKFVDEGIKEAYRKGSGNAAEVNLLLVSMLREAGLNAYPVLTGTHTADTPVFPTRDGFNYVIVQVVINGKYHLLDATELKTTLDVLPDRIAQWKGRVIKNEKKSEWIDLEKRMFSEINESTTINFNEDLSANYSTQRSLNQFAAYKARTALANANKKKVESELTDHMSAVSVDQYDIINLDETDQPLIETFSGVLTGGWNLINDKLYVEGLSYHTMRSNPYTDTDREQPLFLSFPFVKKKTVAIHLPEGYELESLPKPINLSYNDGQGVFSYEISEVNGLIKTQVEINLPFSKVLSEDYKEFQNFISSVIDKEAERIIFVKKQ